MRRIWNPEILLPPILVEDERLRAAKLALERQLRLVSEAAVECILFPRLDVLDESVLDLLAAQFHVDYYLPVGMDIETKRAFIRQSILDHRIKGTPYAVETAMRRLFSDATVREWYEYGGEPYYFRVTSDLTPDDTSADRDIILRLHAAIEATKNARSWLEYIDFRVDHEDSIAASDGLTLEVELSNWDEYDYGRADVRYDGAVKADGSEGLTGFVGADFERISFDADIGVDESVGVEDEFTLAVALEPTADTIDASEDAGADLEQRVVADGYYEFDGAADFDALDVADGVVLLDHAELERWHQLHDELVTTFNERCTCGAGEYDWRRSYVRLGEEKFSILDPQLVTVQARCARCGYIIAEYVVPDSEWKVIIQ